MLSAPTCICTFTCNHSEKKLQNRKKRYFTWCKMILCAQICENISSYPKATEASFLTAAIMDVLTISMMCE